MSAFSCSMSLLSICGGSGRHGGCGAGQGKKARAPAVPAPVPSTVIALSVRARHSAACNSLTTLSALAAGYSCSPPVSLARIDLGRRAVLSQPDPRRSGPRCAHTALAFLPRLWISYQLAWLARRAWACSVLDTARSQIRPRTLANSTSQRAARSTSLCSLTTLGGMGEALSQCAGRQTQARPHAFSGYRTRARNLPRPSPRPTLAGPPGLGSPGRPRPPSSSTPAYLRRASSPVDENEISDA